MSEAIDYEKVGLICGLEVHQQLLTERKLFCHCPAGKYTTEHDAIILRHMRPTLSELGEYDGTALMEFKTRKNIIYLLHHSNVCTYELDDTPPFRVNQQGLDVAIEQCLMLGCDIVDEVHIARKQYLDGSIPTGFQRTAIVGVSGSLPFRGRELKITQVSLEEDSCREVSDRGHLIIWRTDRLGMPLIETVTEPTLRTPEEVEEAILLIGRVCRSTGHVRTGIGASRQDVNVSVRGGRRVEIKGVPKASWAARLVHNEAIRQVNLLKLRDELHQRGFTSPDKLRSETFDITRFLERSSFPFFHRQNWENYHHQEGRQPEFELGKGDFRVKAIKLNGLKGTLNWPTQPELTFAHEIAGRVRVISGLDQQPIIVHSERWPDYHLSRKELKFLKKKLRCGPDDIFVVVWGAEEDTDTALKEILIRYQDALDGVPSETRQPFSDGSTDFERILPGPERMYPDTDSPPERVTRERVEKLQQALPDPPWIREERYSKAGLPKETIHYLIRRNGARLVDLVVEKAKADLKQAGFLFGEKLKGLRRAGIPVDAISDEQWIAFFNATHKKPVIWEAWKQLISSMAQHPQSSCNNLIERLHLGTPPQHWKEELAQKLQDIQPDHPNESPQQRFRFLIGHALKTLRGRVPATEVIAYITTLMENDR